MQEGTRKGRETDTLTTSGDATVYFDMKGRSNKVTVSHRNFSATVIYIYGIPQLRKTGGTDKEGAASGRLEDPLVVKVTDPRGSAISDLAVTFTATAPAPATAPPATDRFKLVPGTLYGADRVNKLTAKSTTPAQDSPLTVYTDGNGEARTYYYLSESGDQNVTVKAAGETVEFIPKIETATRRPTLDILSGNNQRTDANGDTKDTLVVVVRQDGNRYPDHPVTFVAKKGSLTGGKKRVKVNTDGNGEAEFTVLPRIWFRQ